MEFSQNTQNVHPGKNRRVYLQSEFDEIYRAKQAANDFSLRKCFVNWQNQYLNKNGDISSFSILRKTVLGFFPIINNLRHYKIKDDLLRDVIAGLTVFVMAIPQGMAYGILTGMGAIYGLYSSTFPLFVYFLLGTSRQTNLGTRVKTHFCKIND